MEYRPVLTELQQVLQKAGLYLGDLDGLPGPKFDSAIKTLRAEAIKEFRATSWVKTKTEANPDFLVVAERGIPQEAIDLILKAEGVDQPYKWPGGMSGITLGYGVDIGADPDSLDYWRDELHAREIEHLSH